MRSKIRSNELDEFTELAIALLLIVRCKACIPGFHERFNLIIDFVNCNCSKSFVNDVMIR